MKISLNQQIEEVALELSYRSTVYNNLIAKGKMTQSVADYRVERMKAALATLQWLQKNEKAVRALWTGPHDLAL